MFNIFKYNPNARSLEGLNNVRKTQFILLWTFVLLITLYLAYKMIDATYMLISVDGIRWDYSKLAWLLYIFGLIAILLQPRYGIYLTVGLALAGDYFITYWFPFELNFSSKQSLLYLNDSLKLSPLETYLLFTLLAYVLRLLLSSKWNWADKIYFGPLFLPALGFTGFIIMGFVYGMTTGGDRQIGLWEVRPILYLFLVLYLTSNLFEKREHIKTFMWIVVAALTYEGIMGVIIVGTLYRWSFSGFDGLGAHSAAVHFNTVFAFVAVAFLYKVSWPKRLLLLSILPPIAFTYVAMQRRASMLTLVISLSLSGVIIFKLHRKFFYVLAPTATIIGMVYVAAFWNSGSAVAMPAQAIKSVIASDDANESDRSSNEYRLIENSNTHYTIQTYPLTGVGFGKKFIIVYPMPDISFFEWWEYITHNSIVWIWMKSGVGGFFFMNLLISMGLITGGRLIWRMPNSEVSAVVLVMVLYIVMHFMFAYVDMSWEAQSMLYVGAAFGIINAAERIMNAPVKLQEKRWDWQKEPEPTPMMEEAA